MTEITDLDERASLHGESPSPEMWASGGREGEIGAADRPSEVLAADHRFAALLGPAAWARLPAAVRARFGRRVGPGESIIFAGVIVESRRTWAGALVAQACRAIGAPLPLGDDPGAAVVVTITEDPATGGQFWTRVYGRARGFPQVVHSMKRFAGPTGLEEHLGCGFSIALDLGADAEGLSFRTRCYVLGAGPWRLRLPPWLGPGALTVTHVDHGDGRFTSAWALRHPALGVIFRQTGVYVERGAALAADHAAALVDLARDLPLGPAPRGAAALGLLGELP